MKLIQLRNILNEAIDRAGGESATPAQHADVLIFEEVEGEPLGVRDYKIKRIGQFGVKPDVTIRICPVGELEVDDE